MPIMPNEVQITRIIPSLVNVNGTSMPGVRVYFSVREQAEQFVTMTNEQYTVENAKRLVTAAAEKEIAILDMFK